jgi:hypothetical protein
VAALQAVVLGRVYQNINEDGTLITNLAELQPGVSQLGLFPVRAVPAFEFSHIASYLPLEGIERQESHPSHMKYMQVLGPLGQSVARLRVEAACGIVSPSRVTLTFTSARFEPLTLFGRDVADVSGRATRGG